MEYSSKISALSSSVNQAENSLKEERQKCVELNGQLNVSGMELCAARVESKETQERMQTDINKLSVRVCLYVCRCLRFA